MNVKRLFRKRLALIVCAALVALSGYALASSGRLENPFTVVSEVTRLVSADTSSTFGGEVRGGAAEGTDRPAPRSGDFGGDEGSGGPGGGREGEGLTSIQWSQVGGVLANLWYIAAATVVMAIVGPMIGWLLKHLRPPRRPALSTAVIL